MITASFRARRWDWCSFIHPTAHTSAAVLNCCAGHRMDFLSTAKDISRRRFLSTPPSVSPVDLEWTLASCPPNSGADPPCIAAAPAALDRYPRRLAGMFLPLAPFANASPVEDSPGRARTFGWQAARRPPGLQQKGRSFDPPCLPTSLS